MSDRSAVAYLYDGTFEGLMKMCIRDWCRPARCWTAGGRFPRRPLPAASAAFPRSTAAIKSTEQALTYRNKPWKQKLPWLFVGCGGQI